jgi:hypothetical protein
MTVPLPPLPPVDGGDEQYRPGGRSMVELLAEEHEQFAALCRELTDTGGTGVRRGQIAQVLTASVARHLSAEEQYLYPTVRAALPDGAPLADREVAADAALLQALKELAGSAPGDSRFDQLAGRVADGLDRHARAAASEIFPELREIATDAELIRLGNRVEIAEEAAPTRPHPGTPGTPPWNRVVEPAMGVVDKVRDAVTGRRTYVDDLTGRPRV